MMIAALAAGHLLLAAPTAVPPERASRILGARNLGIAQLEEGKAREARRTFERLAELVPNEPLPFANGAVAAIREADLAAAERLVTKARGAGGERSAEVWAVAAALEEARNRPEEQRSALARAAALDPRHLESRWRWVRSAEAAAAPPAALKEGRRRYLAEIVSASPANLPALLKLLLADLEAGRLEDARKGLGELSRLLADAAAARSPEATPRTPGGAGGGAPPPNAAAAVVAEGKTSSYLAEATSLLGKGDAKAASLKVRVVENLLRGTARYQQSLVELWSPVQGLPLLAFSPALEAALRPAPGAAVPVSLREAGAKAEDPSVTLRRVDLGNNGSPTAYELPAGFSGAAFLDVDLDGDLDVYLFGGKADRLLRNNLDGSFTDTTAGTSDSTFSSRRAVVVDADRDGDLDLACVEASGELTLRVNLRQGRFRTERLGFARASDVAAEDLNADGLPDLAVASAAGVTVLSNLGEGRFAAEASRPLTSAAEAVLLADLDNDGFPDLVASAGGVLHAFRRSARDAFTPWSVFARPAAGAGTLLARDVDQDGDLDLVAERAGVGSVLTNEGGNANAWIDVVLEGLSTGSGKVNRAGLGSLVEVKAGDLYVARTVGVLPTRLGLGARSKADVVRVLFTNGVPQNAFDRRARAVLKEVQRLKGSCPFVYAHDGRSGTWSFVSDALGRAPIGLLYDGVHLAGADTTEWLFVDGSKLAPAPDGRLLLDYTEELWEAAYLDEATLVAVDHPEGTEIVPNERTVPFPLERKLFTAARPRAPRGAWSEAAGERRDVLELLSARDGRHVSPGPETYYQGRRDEHALVLDLGPVRREDRVVLFLNGWIFYTDTSINVSMSQRKDLAHYPPVLEVPDGKGGWRVAMESFGFPAGKSKTMPVDLTGLLDPADARLRIRTTMAVFWDEVFVTVNDPEVPVRTTRVPLLRATLSYRGFSRRYREGEDGPEVFDHEDVSTAPAWEDVPGLVTRYGDVTETLAATDDRYVVFVGGDAIRLTYDGTRLPPLPEGWRRDWLLVSDGWDKDFDRNTVTGQSVAPYPFHAMSGYPYPPGEEHPDPAFLRETLTREVGPRRFRESLGAPR